MIFASTNGLSTYHFESFDSRLVGDTFFSRKGGVSPAPWSSLNQGGTVGDERANVIENRSRAFTSIDRPVESIYDVWQVHSADIVVAEKPRPLDAEHVKADAIVTTNLDVTLFMRFADCVPILMYSAPQKVIAIVHAGWQGTVKKIVEKTVKFLIKEYKVDPETITAGIGPSIGVCHYQVGLEVIQTVKTAFPQDHESLISEKEGAYYLDLWKTNELQLLQNGVKSIEVARICTACNTTDWYSHRAEKGKTGRFGAAFWLKKAD